MKIGNTSFSDSGLEKFHKLSKEKQIEKITNGLSPKDPVQAEKLLNNIPNGDTKSENSTIGETDTASATGGNKKNNPKVAGTDKSEG